MGSRRQHINRNAIVNRELVDRCDSETAGLPVAKLLSELTDERHAQDRALASHERVDPSRAHLARVKAVAYANTDASETSSGFSGEPAGKGSRERHADELVAAEQTPGPVRRAPLRFTNKVERYAFVELLSGQMPISRAAMAAATSIGTRTVRDRCAGIEPAAPASLRRVRHPAITADSCRPYGPPSP